MKNILLVTILSFICVHSMAKENVVILATKVENGKTIVIAKYEGKLIEGVTSVADKEGYLLIKWQHLKQNDQQMVALDSLTSLVRTSDIKRKLGKKIGVIGNTKALKEKIVSQNVITTESTDSGDAIPQEEPIASKSPPTELSPKNAENIKKESKKHKHRFSRNNYYGSYSPMLTTSTSSASNIADISVSSTSVTTLPPCTPYIDLKKEKLFERHRTVSDTVCRKKKKSYDLKRKYNKCSDIVNLNKKLSYRRYNYYYSVAGNKDITLPECHIDKSQSYAINADYESCGLHHNFIEGFSQKKKKHFYLGYTGKRVNIDQCGIEDKKHSHHISYDECSVEYVGTKAILSKRSFVEIDGKRQYITECTPEAKAVELSDEICIDRFTHQFAENRSYYNKRKYAISALGNKIYVGKCSKTVDFVDHKSKTDNCQVQNNDKTKSFHRFYQVFITDKYSQKETMIKDCTKSEISVPYSRTGILWEVLDSSTQNIRVNNLNNGMYVGRTSWSVLSKTDARSRCLNNGITPIWHTSTSKAIDVTKSDGVVDYEAYFSSKDPNALFSTMGIMPDPKNYYLICRNPKCLVTHAVSHPQYKRGDNSIFTDLSVTNEHKYVCGTGSKL